MIEVVPLESLGRLEAGWLSARYHFSFADYFDPERMGIGPLRVWNDDLIRPGGGFPMHPHRDMEIVTYVRRGAVTHEDDLGNRGRVEAGRIQVMSAGTGIVHSEFNLEDGDLALFQIWIQPHTMGLAPRWETRDLPAAGRSGGLVALASGRRGDDGAVAIHQDAALLAAELAAGQVVSHTLEPGRRAYLVAARGAIAVNGVRAPERAGITVTGERDVIIAALGDSEVVLVDLP